MKNVLILLGILLITLSSCEKMGGGTCRCTDGYSGVTEEYHSESSEECNSNTQRAAKNGYPLRCSFTAD